MEKEYKYYETKGKDLYLKNIEPYDLWLFIKKRCSGGLIIGGAELVEEFEEDAAWAERVWENKRKRLQKERWRECKVCGRLYRPKTVHALESIPEAAKENMCWPCYDGFYDCCYGPEKDEFEYRRITSKIRCSRKWFDMLREVRKRNRNK